MPIGFHVSIAGGISLALQRALRLGCETFQIFSRNPRGWKGRVISHDEVRVFKTHLNKSGISPLILHTPYLINLATPEEGIYKRSISIIKEDIERGNLLGADFLVTHIGSTKGEDVDYGIKRVIKAIEEVFKGVKSNRVRLLLENSSGSGYYLGGCLEDIGKVMEYFKGRDLLGLCLDTCHAFSAGYPLYTKSDIDSLVESIDRFIGIENLFLLHINDSKGGFGSRLDLHEHLGRGRIGLRGLRAFVSHRALKNLPMILETPREGDEDDLRNLMVIREMLQ